MISGDASILNEASDTHHRMRAYSALCDELHIIILNDHIGSESRKENLFCYGAQGNGIMRRARAYAIARHIVRSRGADIITAQSPDELGFIAYAIARLFHIRLQIQIHTDILSPWYRRGSFLARMRYLIARFIIPRADCIRVVSKRIARSLMQQMNIPASSIAIVPIYTDVKAFMNHPSNRNNDERLVRASCAILSAGRFMDGEKNFRMLIMAMTEVVAACPTAVLILVGDGPEKGYYESLIKVLRLERNVFLESWCDDLSLWYASFDLFVLPSYIEGWGRTAIEAMAAGLPVVMTDVGMAGDVVRDGINGRVVPVADRHALVSALVDLCNNEKKRAILGKTARETVLNLKPANPQEYLAQWRGSFDCCRSDGITNREE